MPMKLQGLLVLDDFASICRFMPSFDSTLLISERIKFCYPRAGQPYITLIEDVESSSMFRDTLYNHIGRPRYLAASVIQDLSSRNNNIEYESESVHLGSIDLVDIT